MDENLYGPNAKHVRSLRTRASIAWAILRHGTPTAYRLNLTYGVGTGNVSVPAGTRLRLVGCNIRSI